MRAIIQAARIVVVALAALLVAAPASAEFKLLGMDTEGDVSVGVRSFIDEPDHARKGKLEEYRDITNGVFLDQLRLNFFLPDSPYSVGIGGSKWGQDDQEFSITSGRLGLWQFGFEWDETRHLYSTTSQFLGTQVQPGLFSLPVTARGATFATLQQFNAAPEHDIEQHWESARVYLMLTPTPDLDFRAQYTRIYKDGEKPFSINFASSPGDPFWNVPVGIDQTIHDVRLRGTLMRETWQIQANYAFSEFNNGVKSIIADNPFAAPGPWLGAGLAPQAAQMSVEPDNMAHTFNIQGGISLPLRTRVTANLGYSLRLQDEPFLQQTINPVLLAANPALALPRKSLDGMVGVANANLNLVTRPITPLTVSFKYRLFDYSNMSAHPVFAAHSLGDKSVAEGDRAAHVEYTRQNADLDFRVQVLRAVAVTLGGGWERWDRKVREVPVSDELFGKLAIDVTPLDWASVRFSYKPSIRRISTYDTFLPAKREGDTSDFEELVGGGQSVFLRKYDEGERNRHKAEVQVQLMPLETVSLTLTGDWHHDEYLGGVFGLRSADGYSAGADFSWNPVERVGFSGGYVYENSDQFMHSRNRPFVNGAAVDLQAFDWTSNMLDTTNTAYAGVKVTLLPKLLDWTASGSFSETIGKTVNRNPGNPSAVTVPGAVGSVFGATAKPWPEFEDNLIRFDTAIRYHFSKGWTASLGYVFESFQKDDWRTEGVPPVITNPTTVTSVFLGADQKNYTAHLIGLTLGYRWQ